MIEHRPQVQARLVFLFLQLPFPGALLSYSLQVCRPLRVMGVHSGLLLTAVASLFMPYVYMVIVALVETKFTAGAVLT